MSSHHVERACPSVGRLAGYAFVKIAKIRLLVGSEWKRSEEEAERRKKQGVTRRKDRRG